MQHEADIDHVHAVTTESIAPPDALPASRRARQLDVRYTALVLTGVAKQICSIH